MKKTILILAAALVFSGAVQADNQQQLQARLNAAAATAKASAAAQAANKNHITPGITPHNVQHNPQSTVQNVQQNLQQNTQQSVQPTQEWNRNRTDANKNKEHDAHEHDAHEHSEWDKNHNCDREHHNDREHYNCNGAALVPIVPATAAAAITPDNIANYKQICSDICGGNYALQNPEMRDYLTCIDGDMKDLNASDARSDCTRFDYGPWASQRNGAWCVKVNDNINTDNYNQPVQCLGLVPAEQVGR